MSRNNTITEFSYKNFTWQEPAMRFMRLMFLRRASQGGDATDVASLPSLLFMNQLTPPTFAIFYEPKESPGKR